ncbi:DUF6210 family protein [Spirillospora sp. NPDC050679]
MTARRYVFLDPDGTADGWLHVIVEAGTGVVYQHQYGGTANRQGEAEGFLVPLSGRAALAALRDLFEKRFRGAGTWGLSWPEAERERLRGIVESVSYWSCDGRNEKPYPLRLDESRATETDEAWVPVLTPDGPGTLVWHNSD